MNTEVLIATVREDARSVGIAERLPSLFEVVLVEQINGMMKPAFHQLVTSALDSIPESQGALSRMLLGMWEELYDVVNLALQWQSIRGSGSSFAERLYGLTRRSVDEADTSMLAQNSAGQSGVVLNSSSPLSRWQQDFCLAVLVALPRILDILRKISKSIRLNAARIRAQNIQAMQRAERERQQSFTGMPTTGEGAEAVAESSVESSFPPFTSFTFRRVRRMAVTAADSYLSFVNLVAGEVGIKLAQAFPFVDSACGVAVALQVRTSMGNHEIMLLFLSFMYLSLLLSMFFFWFLCVWASLRLRRGHWTSFCIKFPLQMQCISTVQAFLTVSSCHFSRFTCQFQ